MKMTLIDVDKGTEERERVNAFIKWHKSQGNDPREISDVNDDTITIGRNEEYLVLKDVEADERVKAYISESVWAFNPDFLVSYMPDGVDQEVIKLLQEKCEGANEAIKAMIKDFDGFVEDAISADGRGHFMSSYDGEEHEVIKDGKVWFIYRIN